MISQDLTLAIAKNGVQDSVTEPIYSVRDLYVYHNSVIDYILGIDKNDKQQSTNIPALYTYNCDGKHTYDNFTNSNVVIIDLDDKPDKGYNYEYTAKIFENPLYFGTCVMPSVLFIQKSCNGASHIAVKIPMAKTKEQYEEYAIGVTRVFKNKFKEEFKVSIPEDVLDEHSNICTQACFLSPHKIINCDDVNTVPLSDADMIDLDSIFGYKKNGVSDRAGFCSCEQTPSVVAVNNVNLNKEKEVRDGSDKTMQDRNDIQDSSLKSCGCIENVTDCESDSHILNKTHDPSKVAPSYSITPLPYITTATFEGWFENNVKIPYCDNQIALDFSYTKKKLNEILDEVIEKYKDDSAYKITLYRPAIYAECIYNVKLKLFRPYNADGPMKIQQGGKRRLNIKKVAKVAILNYIASVNYGNEFIKDDNIIATIKHYIMNHIETKGDTRDIDDDMVISLIKELKNNWDSIKIEYSINSFWYKRGKDEDNVVYMHSLQKRKYATIDSTVKSFIEANNLGGMGYGKIAEILNIHSIASKTKKGWSEFSVGNIFRKDSSKPESTYKNRIDELINEGLMYKDIAETLNKEGYTTKQGKAFNAKSIENYVARKK